MSSARPRQEHLGALTAGVSAYTEVAAESVHLAPPLPPPPADLRLLAAGLVVLGVTVVLTWFSAQRLRRPAAPVSSATDRALGQLVSASDQAQCPSRGSGQAEHCAGGSHPCADGVRRALVEFASTASGLPCASLTTQELRAAAGDLPADLRTAVVRVADVLDACDRCRFERDSRYEGCLVAAAVGAVCAWPAAPGVRRPVDKGRVAA